MAVTIGTVSRSGQGIARGSVGKVTGDGNQLRINLGFRPKRVTIYNVTDALKWEAVDGMAATITLKTVTAGTQTADTTSAIVIDDQGFTTTAALFANTKAIVWAAD